jgi:hypothetical protein
VTADPRATARQWLAETIRAVPGSDEMAPAMPNVLAGAILADVEVTTILRPIDDSRRTALLLPAEEGETA